MKIRLVKLVIAPFANNAAKEITDKGGKLLAAEVANGGIKITFEAGEDYPFKQHIRDRFKQIAAEQSTQPFTPMSAESIADVLNKWQ